MQLFCFKAVKVFPILCIYNKYDISNQFNLLCCAMKSILFSQHVQSHLKYAYNLNWIVYLMTTRWWLLFISDLSYGEIPHTLKWQISFVLEYNNTVSKTAIVRAHICFIVSNSRSSPRNQIHVRCCGTERKRRRPCQKYRVIVFIKCWALWPTFWSYFNVVN